MAQALRLAALLSAGALAACSAQRASKEETVQVMEEFTMTRTNSGVTTWRLKSPSARFTLDGRGLMEAPELEFYRQGRVASTARAREAFVHSGARDMALVGDVVIASRQERSTLRTRRLQYRSSDERFSTDDPVVIERPDALIRGRGMDADSTLSDINVYHQETVVR